MASKCKKCGSEDHYNFALNIELCDPCIGEELEALLAENEKLKGLFERIQRWAKAYPLKVFPEPDFKKVAEVLKAAGLSLDAVSASNMRHVINRVKDVVGQALKGE